LFEEKMRRSLPVNLTARDSFQKSLTYGKFLLLIAWVEKCARKA
jgi:hypothetical protein